MFGSNGGGGTEKMLARVNVVQDSKRSNDGLFKMEFSFLRDNWSRSGLPYAVP